MVLLAAWTVEEELQGSLALALTAPGVPSGSGRRESADTVTLSLTLHFTQVHFCCPLSHDITAHLTIFSSPLVWCVCQKSQSRVAKLSANSQYQYQIKLQDKIETLPSELRITHGETRDYFDLHILQSSLFNESCL